MLVLVVFLRSRLCLLHGNDNRLLFEMTTTVYERKNCVSELERCEKIDFCEDVSKEPTGLAIRPGLTRLVRFL